MFNSGHMHDFDFMLSHMSTPMFAPGFMYDPMHAHICTCAFNHMRTPDYTNLFGECREEHCSCSISRKSSA